MNIYSLYRSPSFYDTTSALNGNPFVNPRTCGVAGTMRGSCLSANPAFGNIGYANRISGTGNWFTDVLGTVRDIVTPTAAALADVLVQKGFKAAREKMGYTFLEVVQIQQGGQSVYAQKVKKPDGTFAVILADGSEIPYTSEIASATRPVSPTTGLTTGQTAGLAVGAVALVALFLFMSKRR